MSYETAPKKLVGKIPASEESFENKTEKLSKDIKRYNDLRIAKHMARITEDYFKYLERGGFTRAEALSTTIAFVQTRFGGYFDE